MLELIDHLPRILIGLIFLYFGFFRIKASEENKNKVLLLKIAGVLFLLLGSISLIEGLK